MGNKRKTWFLSFRRELNRSLRWLAPGIGVKRWLLLLLAGITLLAVGLGILLLDIYRTAPETWWLPVLSFLSLRFLTRPMRFLIFGGNRRWPHSDWDLGFEPRFAHTFFTTWAETGGSGGRVPPP